MNSNLSSIDFILIFAYFIVLIIIGYITSRKQRYDDFLIAERNLGTWSTMATVNASKTGSILMIIVALIYLQGISALWYFIGVVLGFLLFIPFALKLKDDSHNRYYTLADYFKHNYGKKIAVLASLVTIFLMFGVLTLNLMAGTKVFVFFTGWPFWICAIISIMIVLAYLLLGGYDAVVKTDVIQYIAIIFIFIALTVVMFNGSLIPASDWNFFNAGASAIVGFFLIGVLYPFAMPELWQRVYSSRDKKTLRNGLLISAAIFGGVAFLLGLVALSVKANFPNVHPDLALLHGFNTLLPTGLLGLGVVLLFAAIMSSIDTYIYTGASAIVQDFFFLSRRRTVKYIRRAIFILAIAALIVAILIQDLVIGAYIFISFAIVLAVISATTWLRKSVKQRTLIIGMVIGLICLTIFLAIGLSKGEVKPNLVVIGFISTIIGLIIGGIISFFRK